MGPPNRCSRSGRIRRAERSYRGNGNVVVSIHLGTRPGSAIATAAPEVREELRALLARITDTPMPALMLEEVVAARGSRPDAAPAARPMTSADIVEEYR
eukprot:gene17188-biopygen13210